MAFVAIDPSIIEAGDPVIQDLFDKIRTNFDDHESRLTSLEGGSAVSYVPYNFQVNGVVSDFTTIPNAVGISRIPFNITVLGGRVLAGVAGSSGSHEIDILYKRGAGAWTSIFSTRPSVAAASGDYAIDSGVLSVTALQIGDLIKMDVTSTQNGTAKGLTGILEFSKT